MASQDKNRQTELNKSFQEVFKLEADLPLELRAVTEQAPLQERLADFVVTADVVKPQLQELDVRTSEDITLDAKGGS